MFTHTSFDIREAERSKELLSVVYRHTEGRQNWTYFGFPQATALMSGTHSIDTPEEWLREIMLELEGKRGT